MFITNNTIRGYNSAISAFMSPFGSVSKQSLTKLRNWPHFESEGFWNSEVAYCVREEIHDTIAI